MNRLKSRVIRFARDNKLGLNIPHFWDLAKNNLMQNIGIITLSEKKRKSFWGIFLKTYLHGSYACLIVVSYCYSSLNNTFWETNIFKLVIGTSNYIFGIIGINRFFGTDSLSDNDLAL